MSLHAVLLALHVAAGGAGLVLAAPVMWAPKRRGVHTLLGRAYALATAVLCLSAFGLIAYDPARLVGLGVLNVLTVGWVGAGVWLARPDPAHGQD
ncbi:MAG TPA: hypothetical protein VNV66_17340, partial [Pilimelia sp.]|nr:hypothetical protein [Pilimelia sp.]